MGTLKTVYQALQATPMLTGVSLKFGKKWLVSNQEKLPRIVMIPVGGSYNQRGYTSAKQKMIAGAITKVDFHCWAVSSTGAAEDHMEQLEALETNLLQALEYIRPNNLMYQLVSHDFIDSEGQSNYGRALIVSVQFERSISDVVPQYATIKKETITQGNT